MRQYTNHDAQIIDTIQQYVKDREEFEYKYRSRLTFRLLARLSGISEPAAYNRLNQMRDRGLITWNTSLSTIRILSDDLEKMKHRAPVGRAKSSLHCTARGCANLRHGDQWCIQHEEKFRQYSGSPLCAST